MSERVCLHCDTRFNTYNAKAKYCNRSCFLQSKKKEPIKNESFISQSICTPPFIMIGIIIVSGIILKYIIGIYIQ